MLQITIPSIEKWDEGNQEFVHTKERTLRLEHSLISISKWESKWCKPFFGKKDKTLEESLDYIKCMALTQNVPPEVYEDITNANISAIVSYMEAPMTATWFSENKSITPSQEVITSELIYYWMTVLNVPFECEKWHLNRLLTLIKVCNIKNNPPKKMNRKEIMTRNAALNEARKKQLNTKG